MTDTYRNHLSSFGIALQFMTRLPGLTRAGWTQERERASVGFYPACGVVSGLIAACVYWLAAHVFAAPLASLLAVATAILVTGALHEDGLADVCDGVGGGKTRDKALAIMKDSQIGVYGTLGLILFIGAKILAKITMPAIATDVLAVRSTTTRKKPCVSSFLNADHARWMTMMINSGATNWSPVFT